MENHGFIYRCDTTHMSMTIYLFFKCEIIFNQKTLLHQVSMTNWIINFCDIQINILLNDGW